ncbi:2535_t:CDS:2 [Entrophospora sp. SA101]|nr:2535_t:CDS:2 [Entrophospora sp. SA101]
MSGSSRKEFIQTYRDSTPGVNTITDWDVRYNDMAQGGSINEQKHYFNNGYQKQMHQSFVKESPKFRFQHSDKMTKITTKEFPEFDKKLNELLERKPPGTSASKIKDLTKIALNTPKQYKNIVYSIQKFIQRCPSDYKLGALYVLDSISQSALKKKVLVMSKKVDDISSNTNTSQSSSPSWTGIEYLDRFEKLLEEMFTHIMQCPEHDKDKVERVLDLWYDKEVYNNEVIQRIKDIYFNQITLITQLVNSVNETKSVIVSSSNNDPKNMNPTTMDSSALLATLNNLTQGTLNIPSFLSSNPIISNTSMQPNAPTPFNNVPVNSNQPPHPIPPPHQILQQQQPELPITSYTANITPLSTNNNNYVHSPTVQNSKYSTTTNDNSSGSNDRNMPEPNNPLEFDYDDSTPSNQQHKKDITTKQTPSDPNQLITRPHKNQHQQISPGNIQQPSPSFPFNPLQPWTSPIGQPSQLQTNVPPQQFHAMPWNNNGAQQNLMQPAPWNSNSSQQPNVPFITPLGYNGPPTSVPPVSQPVYSLPPPAATNASATSNITGAAGPNPPQQQPGQLSPSGVPLIAGSIQPTSQISTFTPIAPVTQTVTYQSSPQQTPIPQDICLVYEDQSVGMKYIKVVSRTLYVGSVSEDMPKDVMQEMFKKFGSVASVTV